MIDHLKQLSADTEEVILATCALARRAGGTAEAAGGSVQTSGAPEARELTNELAAVKEQLRAHESRVAEWERKVASAEEAQKVAAESFKKGQKDVQMFKQQCAKLEEDVKAEKALREEAEKKVCLLPFLSLAHAPRADVSRHYALGSQADGSGLRQTADALRKELESARANLTGAIPSATHDATLRELKQVRDPCY